MTVLSKIDGNCLTASSFGSRVDSPDCVVSPTIETTLGQTVRLWQQPTLTITASSATVQPGDPTPQIAPSYSGFVGAAPSLTTLATPATCTTSYTPTSGPGTYASYCTGAVDPYYRIVYVNGTVTVPTAPMVITAPSFSLNYGAPVPNLAPAFGGDPGGSLTTQPTCTTTYSPTSGPGTRDNLLRCGGTDDRHQLHREPRRSADLHGRRPGLPDRYVNGTITVQSVALTITASSRQ